MEAAIETRSLDVDAIPTIEYVETPHLQWFPGPCDTSDPVLPKAMRVIRMKTVCMPDQEDEDTPFRTLVQYLLYQQKPSMWEEDVVDVTVSAFPTLEQMQQWAGDIREPGCLAAGRLLEPTPFVSIPMSRPQSAEEEEEVLIGDLFVPTASAHIVFRKDGRVVRRYETVADKAREQQYARTMMVDDTVMDDGEEGEEEEEEEEEKGGTSRAQSGRAAKNRFEKLEKGWNIKKKANVWCLFPQNPRVLENLLYSVLLELSTEDTVSVCATGQTYHVGEQRWESEKGGQHLPCVMITFSEPAAMDVNKLRGLPYALRYVSPCLSESQM